MERKNGVLTHYVPYLKLVGLWKISVKSEFLKKIYKLYGVLVFLYIFFFLVLQIIDVLLNLNDIEKLTMNLSTSLMTTTSVGKSFSILINRRKFQDVITRLTERDEIDSQKSKNASMIFQKETKRSKRFAYFYWIVIGFTVLTMFISPVIEYEFSYELIDGVKVRPPERPFIYRCWLPADPIDDYWWYYFVQFLAGVVGGSYQALWDSLFIALMIHASGQLKMLNDAAKNITYFAGDQNTSNDLIVEEFATEVWEEKYEKQNYHSLSSCVESHYYIQDYVKTINAITSPVMMLYYLISGIMLCTQVYQLLNSGFGDNLKAQYMVAQLTQLFVFFWHADEILEETDRLLQSSYECEWYNQSKRFKTSLLNFRTGLTIPIRFTVGPFFVMSLPTFLGILRMAYSSFAVLRKMEENNIE